MVAVVRPRLLRLRHRPPTRGYDSAKRPGWCHGRAAVGDLVLVSWTASTDTSGISGYRVFRDGGATALTTVTTTSFTDTGLAASTAYSYTVVAVDAAATPMFPRRRPPRMRRPRRPRPSAFPRSACFRSSL